MREITGVTLIDRTTQQVRYSDGKKEYHCRGPHNTIAYYDGGGVLRPQDITAGEETYSKSVSGIWLKRQNKVSVGVRLDGVLNKYLGMRPDVCQDGSEQLEFSIENIKINDKPGTIKLPSAATRVNGALDKYGDYVAVFPYRQGCRQLFRANALVKHFTITYRLHLTGLELVSNDLGEFWFASRKTGEVRFRLRHPVLCDIGTMDPLFLDPDRVVSTRSLLQHTLSQMQPDGTYLYTKESVADLSQQKLPPDYYIDADTVYGTTADGYVYRNKEAVWDDIHDSTTGVASNDTATAYDSSFAVTLYAGYYTICRSFFYFSLASLSGSVTAATFYYYAEGRCESAPCIQQGTQQDTLSTADYDAFSGSYWGSLGNPYLFTYNAISLNSTGLSAVADALGSTMKVCAREYSHDYLDSGPTVSANYRTGCRFAEYIDTNRDPYLSLELSGQPARKRMGGVPYASIQRGVW